MARLLIHVEGQTEEVFVNEVLRPHLYSVGYQVVGARLVGNARLRERRGGVRSWESVKRDIVRHLREDDECLATTMVDYYGMPDSGEGAWPGRAASTALPAEQRAAAVEAELESAVRNSLNGDNGRKRFVPFVVMHEFEGLLFSDCGVFARAIGRGSIAHALQTIRQGFPTPEHINDSPITAPSKRVVALVPEYQKPLYGNIAALEIGLAKMRGECPHFNGWIERLEAIASD